MGFLFGTSAATKAAKEQAAATTKAADATVKNDTLIAQAAAQARETAIGQDTAARTAAELLTAPQGQVDVSLASATPIEVDATTGKRRTTRSTFTSNTPTSGIKI